MQGLHTMKTTFLHRYTLVAVAVSSLGFSTHSVAQATANASVTNNYIWRGLTQTTNEAAVQGGLDYAHESGFYVGTWVSNVQYAADDVYSYEHDLYFGFSGQAQEVSYDIGYLYYNYDTEAEFDFAEVYASVGYAGASATVYILAHTEADEAPGQDFGFAEATYVSLDYAFELRPGTEVGLHAGHHQGDFAEAFNGLTESYNDWAVSLSQQGITLAVSGTDMDGSEPAAATAYTNDDLKFTVSYSIELQL